jgi:hypothetical protein
MHPKRGDILEAVVLIVGLVLCGLIKIFLLYPPNSSQDWAFWVQALGSIGAIIGAFEIARRQYQANLELERDRIEREHKKVLLNILALAAYARKLIGEAHSYRQKSANADSAQHRRHEISKLEDISAALAAIPLHELPVVEAVSALVALRRMVKETSLLLIALGDIRDYYGSDSHAAPFASAADESGDALNVIRQKFS